MGAGFAVAESVLLVVRNCTDFVVNVHIYLGFFAGLKKCWFLTENIFVLVVVILNLLLNLQSDSGRRGTWLLMLHKS